MTGLPPLFGEQHTCPSCALSYADLGVDAARSLVGELPRRLRAVVDDLPPAARHGRPAPDVWSVAEYVCHLRDVHITFTVRLHRARTEDRPALEPMHSDLRAVRFRYDRQDLGGVLDELDLITPGLVEETHDFVDDDWTRPVSRRPDETRTALWVLRQCAHEGVHHTRDVTDVGRVRAGA